MDAVLIEDQWFDCKDLLEWGQQIEQKVLADLEAEVKATVITPGGRVGDDSPFSPSRTDNWVARGGGLPKYVRIVARGIMKGGKKISESRAISMAIGVLKNWASGKGKVSAKVRPPWVGFGFMIRYL